MFSFLLDDRNINRTYSDHPQDGNLPNRPIVDSGSAPVWLKGKVAMFTLIAILMFAGALSAAGFAIYATVAPALPKIRAALTGQDFGSSIAPLPARRVSTLRVTVRPSAQPSYWRAAA